MAPEAPEGSNWCAQVAVGYHVRVLVPCYKEDLEIVAKTIQAAYNARLPDNCSRTIYLCDDGKDKRKRKWCATFKLPSMLHNPVCMLCSLQKSHATACPLAADTRYLRKCLSESDACFQACLSPRRHRCGELSSKCTTSA